jgi:lysophospholipase L1-like esterase
MADLWTGVVRRALVAKLGAGGPGFVHLGFDPKKYRHDGVKLDLMGKFSVLPVPYSKMKREDDGVFGLGGLRFSPAEGEAHAIAEVTEGSARGAELVWDLAYRAEPGATLRVTAPGVDAMVKGEDEAGVGGIRHRVLRSTGASGKLDVTVTGGRPELLGVTVEGETPGLVLDTVGLNGARVGTFLAWDRDAWVAELSRRSPQLVVLAFGTNESADRDVMADKYRKAMAALLERVRAGAPEADCLVITPIDRPGPDYATRLAEITRGYEDAAKAAGCATWSALGAMGGHGSMEAWSHESPPRSGADGIHLTGKGYEFLGQRLAKDMLEGLGG